MTTEFRGDAIKPTNIHADRTARTLTIDWADGHQSVYSAVKLRKSCPCAGCRTEREKQAKELFHVLKKAPAADITLDSAQLVGHYAIQLIWSDGHDTGMFDFRYLRALDDA